MTKDTLDPKGLIREAYRMEGITRAECRSIFLDWALSSADERDTAADIRQLLERHGADSQGHPMTAVLMEGAASHEGTGRRGGRKARVPE